MRIAVIGAGAIGLTHCQAIAAVAEAELAGIADPFPGGARLAADFGTTAYPDHRALIAVERPEAAILATPNETHLPIALDCIAAGVPVLVEKPLVNSLAEAETLLAAARAAGLPALVGHLRRHHPWIRRARDLVASGAIGRLAAVSATAFLMKPDAYFEPEWRRTPGIGGPFLINLIHEIDLIRFVCGEIAEVSALASSALRGLAVEDTGALVFRLEGGALVSLVLSDCAAGPWSWDMAAGDSPRFPPHDVNSHLIAGDAGSLTLPRLELWRHDGPRSWTTPMTMERDPAERLDPYQQQIRHLMDVVQSGAPSFVSALEGARNLAVMEAVRTAVESGRTTPVARISG